MNVRYIMHDYQNLIQRTRVFFSLALVALIVIGAPVHACNVPVFRYALEKWPVDAYEVVIFHDKPTTSSLQLKEMVKLLEDQVAGLEAAQDSHIVTTVDVTKPMKKVLAAWHKKSKPTSYPWIFIQYPSSFADDPPAYSGPATLELVKQISMSPMRKRITQQILQGESVVWLFIESGDKNLDEKAEKLVQDQLKLLQGELRLPTLTADDEQFFDPKLGPKLKLGLTLVKVSRDDPAEKMFLRILENWNSELIKPGQPVVFPFFGRGRVLPGLYGDAITKQALTDACIYLTGPCGCQIKRENPGYDVLMSVQWEGLVEGKYTLAEAIPKLTTPAAAIDANRTVNANEIIRQINKAHSQNTHPSGEKAGGDVGTKATAGNTSSDGANTTASTSAVAPSLGSNAGVSSDQDSKVVFNIILTLLMVLGLVILGSVFILKKR
jgi:hypothetical protein